MAGMSVQEGWPRPFPLYDELDDKNWNAFVSQSAEKKIYWDEQHEQFVSRK
jgi:hypothetical protein